jgi:outer membrane biosynthesis protein TonB
MDDETKKRLELLKIARQELNTQYIKDRADAYTQWTIDCDRAWRENGIKLAFPPPPPVPTEADVVAYALALYNAQNPQTAPAPVVEPVVENVEPIKEEPKYEEPNSPPVPDTPRVKPQRIAIAPAPSTAANAIPASDNSQITKLTKVILDTNSTLSEAVPLELKPLFANSAVASLPVTANIPPATSTSVTGLKGVLPAWLQRLHGIAKE